MTKMIKFLGAAMLMTTAALVATPHEASAGENKLYAESRSDVIGVGKNFALGVESGFPWSSIHAKYYWDRKNAITASFGVVTGDFDEGIDTDFGFVVKGQYLGTPAFLVRSPSVTMPFYLGIGAAYSWDVENDYMLINDDDVPFGSDVLNFHVPIGVALQLNRVPLDIYAEFQPGVNFIMTPGEDLGDSDTEWDGKVTVGAHVWF